MEEEGILAGISSGAAVAAALLQEDESFTNKNIVVILPSSGESVNLSTALFADLFNTGERITVMPA